MKKNFKTWLCSVMVLGATLAIGLFAGCSKDDFKDKIDQAFCDHNYGVSATDVKSATCTAEGKEVWTCLDCGKEKTVVLEMIEHDFTVEKGGWTRQKKAATCREEGIMDKRCGVCKTIVTEAIPKKDHDEVPVDALLPTCTTAGYTEYSYCRVCNDFVTPKVTIPALGHNVEIIKGYEATCVSKGLTDGKVCKVSDCQEVLVEQKEIPALGHKIEYLKPVEPTCEETGLTAGYSCSRCDKVYTAQNVVEKLPHVDEDKDGYCDECMGFAFDETLSQRVAVQAGDKAAGHWYAVDVSLTSSSSAVRLSCFPSSDMSIGHVGVTMMSMSNVETEYQEKYGISSVGGIMRICNIGSNAFISNGSYSSDIPVFILDTDFIQLEDGVYYNPTNKSTVTVYFYIPEGDYTFKIGDSLDSVVIDSDTEITAVVGNVYRLEE